MRVGYNGQLAGESSFGVSGVVGNLAAALARTAGDDELVLYVQRSLPGVGAARQVVSPALARVRLGRILWEQALLPGRARRDGLDVFHAPGYVMPLRLRVPALVTLHDVIALSHPEVCKPSNRAHYGLVLAASARRARIVVTLSHAVREHAIERLGLAPERVRVVLPGIAPELRRDPGAGELERVRERHGLSARFVLFVGNPEPKKNLARLAQACEVLRRRGELDGELVITGGEGWGDVLAGVETTRVRRLPYLELGELACVLRLARLLAFPSLVEGFGLPVVEAMACGVPVVSSDVPSVRETDPGAVVTVDPLDVESIADGLRRAWSDEALRAQLVARGLAATRSLSWERAAHETWELYREVARS